MSEHLIIAIDGPAGVGKSTVAKALAKSLEVMFLDTGAMYRTVALAAMQRDADWHNEQSLIDIAQSSEITLKDDKVFLNGEDVSEAIRTPEVTENTQYVAKVKGVREILVAKQQAYGEAQSLVAEGRDVTTVVFKDSPYKFYLDATVEDRVKRRLKDFAQKGIQVDEKELEEQIRARDERDSNREFGALTKADDVIVLDTSGLNVEQSVELVANEIHKLKANSH